MIFKQDLIIERKIFQIYLLNDNLNKIIIITKNSIIFILIYGINHNRYNNIYHIYNEYSEHSQTKICVAKHFRESYIYEDKYYEY